MTSTPKNWLPPEKVLILASFTEGGCLMATEILSARMMAPYFGSSLFVWAAVLAITLGALALGYYNGGKYSTKPQRVYTLFSFLFVAGIWLVLMPFIAQITLNIVYRFELFQAVIIGALTILFVPMFLMGSVSPMIIGILSENFKEGGKIAGRIYAISTLGGILFTFLFAFYLIPHFGVIFPSVLAGILLLIISLIYLFRDGKKKQLLVIPIVIAITLFYAFQRNKTSANMKILYETEGMMGQILVADFNKENTGSERVLFVNRIIQTSYSFGETNVYDYFNITSRLINNLPEKSSILILGLGGGVLANAAINEGHDVDAVEIDDRIVHVAQEYFQLSPKVKVFTDDARRFIKNSNAKYDLIIFDLFRGEETPAHVFTIESMKETAEHLKPSGLILINANGYYRGEIGKGTRALYKTIRSSGLQLNMLATDSVEAKSSMIYLAAISYDSFDNYIPDEWESMYVNPDSLDLRSVKVLSDNKPVLDFLNAKATKAWREAYLNYSKSLYSNNFQPLFR